MTRGVYLRNKRRKAGISLDSAAELLEVTPDSLDDFERGVASKVITLWLEFDRLSRRIPGMCLEEWERLDD